MVDGEHDTALAGQVLGAFDDELDAQPLEDGLRREDNWGVHEVGHGSRVSARCLSTTASARTLLPLGFPHGQC